MDILSSIFPSIPHVALTATATTSTKELIIDSLRLDNAFLVEANPDRSNIFYESKLRPSSGDNKLDAVLAPLADELMGKKMEMPLTIVYDTLATCADAFLFFSQHLGKEQYFPTGADHISKNRLFAQFHAEYPQHEKDRILDEINPLLTKFVQSRWLDIGLALFFVSLWTSTLSRSLNTQRRNWPISSHLDLTLCQ